MRQLYRGRLNALVEALAQELGNILDVSAPVAGIHLVVWLPSGMSAQEAVHRAAVYGLHLLPIPEFSLQSLPRDGLLLGFAGVSPLALALQAY